MVMNAGQLPYEWSGKKKPPKLSLYTIKKEVFGISKTHNEENSVLLEESSTVGNSWNVPNVLWQTDRWIATGRINKKKYIK